MTGTSMAAPHVTGVIALLLASKVLGEHPTTKQIAQRLTETARDLGAPGPDRYYAAGLVDAAAALESGRYDAQSEIPNPPALQFPGIEYPELD